MRMIMNISPRQRRENGHNTWLCNGVIQCNAKTEQEMFRLQNIRERDKTHREGFREKLMKRGKKSQQNM